MESEKPSQMSQRFHIWHKRMRIAAHTIIIEIGAMCLCMTHTQSTQRTYWLYHFKAIHIAALMFPNDFLNNRNFIFIFFRKRPKAQQQHMHSNNWTDDYHDEKKLKWNNRKKIWVVIFKNKFIVSQLVDGKAEKGKSAYARQSQQEMK